MVISASTHSRQSRALLLGILLSLSLSLIPLQAGAQQEQEVTSPAAFASSEFERVWRQTDGPLAQGQVVRSWIWGPAPGKSLTEPFQGAPGNQRLVQYFDKGRMELNSAVTDTTSIWRVTTGLLVAEMVNGQVQTGTNTFQALPPSNQVVAGDTQSSLNPRYSDFRGPLLKNASDQTGNPVQNTLPGRGKLTAAFPNSVLLAKYVPDTGHNIADVFWNYMQKPLPVASTADRSIGQPMIDWVYLLGYPISEPVWCSIVVDGKPQVALIQLFQRRLLTYVPSFPEGWQVQMGNAGQHYYSWRYADSPSSAPAAPAPLATQSPAEPPAGGFVTVSGDSFMLAGSKTSLKGTNYWLSNSPFVGTWVDWNGPQVQRELSKAHELGVNAVRIGISYDHRDTMDIIWGNKVQMVAIAPRIRYLMTQFLQIASGYGMKVIFVLFDWYDPYKYGLPDERTNLLYLEGIVGPFANDDRVLAWDLYNEPEFSDSWEEGGQSSNYIVWLKDIAAMVKSIDSHHPVTVGVGNYSNLWLPAKNGSTILSYVDFASFHSYDAGRLASQIDAVKAHTNKPVLLEEMGWPTSLGDEAPVPNAVYDERTQEYLYTTMLADSKAARIGGVFQWTLWDYWGSQTAYVPGHERFFGLVRPDGTFKPAATVFKDDYVVNPLPSNTFTNLPLDTSAKPRRVP